MAALGLPCNHEKILRPLASVVDMAKWPKLNEGESSWMAWSVLPLMVAYDVPVLHTIRNPWKVIDSLTNRNQILNPLVLGDSALQSVRELINLLLPDLFDREQRVDRAAALVVAWNQLIADRLPNRILVPVDKLNAYRLGDVLYQMGVSRSRDEIQTALDEVSTKTNSGYTVDSVPGVSDPNVAKWLAQYAVEQNCCRVSTRKIRDVAASQTPEELAEAMDPELLDQVNQYASRHGYPTVEVPQLVS
ncbi:hypothetical protein LCGC14_1141540 [marine sediment metagenome]|uniref:Uncharacterized protein n=1 Tax=marine sediment metagenome TaxID=412755 RepID=A0A0F9ML65_9ZZZZ